MSILSQTLQGFNRCLKQRKWLPLLVVAFLLIVPYAHSAQGSLQFDYGDYTDRSTDEIVAVAPKSSSRSPVLKYFSGIPRSKLASEEVLQSQENPECEPAKEEISNAPAEKPDGDSSPKDEKPPPESLTEKPSGDGGPPQIPDTPSASGTSPETVEKSKELHQLVQFVYIAQARVQLEANEIRKAQAVADASQVQLEEAANHVRAVTAALQTAQQEVASAAIRAQTAQLLLAAHDHLLFAARQDVDELSSQMVSLQLAEGIAVPKVTFDVHGLMERLRQPLPDAEKPTAIPPVVEIPENFRKGGKNSEAKKVERKRNSQPDYSRDPYTYDYSYFV